MPYENISLYFKTLHVFGWALAIELNESPLYQFLD